MERILPANKENFFRVAGTTPKKFFAVHRQNTSWPFGLQQKSLLAVSKCLPVVPLRATHFFSRIKNFCQQRNRLELANSA